MFYESQIVFSGVILSDQDFVLPAVPPPRPVLGAPAQAERKIERAVFKVISYGFL